MKSWHEIYRERMNSTYLDHVATKYAPFIQELHGVNAKKSLEIGCGAGNITKLLREMTWHSLLGNKHYWLLDSCPKMLSLAVENNPASNCTFSCANIIHTLVGKFDLIHSHGLLEHFDDHDIRRIVNRCFNSTPVQIHYVPSAEYRTPSRGDERLMTPKQWRDILYDFKRVTISSFNDGLDLIIRVEKK